MSLDRLTQNVLGKNTNLSHFHNKRKQFTNRFIGNGPNFREKTLGGTEKFKFLVEWIYSFIGVEVRNWFVKLRAKVPKNEKKYVMEIIYLDKYLEPSKKKFV